MFFEDQKKGWKERGCSYPFGVKSEGKSFNFLFYSHAYSLNFSTYSYYYFFKNKKQLTPWA